MSNEFQQLLVNNDCSAGTPAADAAAHPTEQSC